MELAPTLTFRLVFMLLLEPIALAKDLQPGAVPRLTGDSYRREGTTSCTGLSLLYVGFVRNVSPLPRRDRVEKSGTAISIPSSLAMERIKPWV